LANVGETLPARCADGLAPASQPCAGLRVAPGGLLQEDFFDDSYEYIMSSRSCVVKRVPGARSNSNDVSSPWPASSAALRCARFDEDGNQDQLASHQGWSAFGAGADALDAKHFFTLVPCWERGLSEDFAPLPCRHFPVRATVRGTSTLTEIEAAVGTLPPKQQRKLLEHLTAKLIPGATLPKPQLSAHDLMKDGCGMVRSGKRDLSTNKKHMQGYGR